MSNKTIGERKNEEVGEREGEGVEGGKKVFFYEWGI